MVRTAADRRVWALPASLLAIAALVGGLAGADPRLGVAGAMGVAFVTIVMADLSVGLCLYALFAFLNIIPNAGASFLSFDKVAGGLLALSWMATVVNRKKIRIAFVAAHPQFFAVLCFFLVWVTLSITWSEFPSKAIEPVSRYVLNAFLFLIVFTAVRNRQHVRWLVGAFVASSTLSGAYGLVVPPAPGAEDRLAGTIGEPNQLAAVLVAGVVLAAALAVVEWKQPLLRIGLLGAAGICLLATFLTLSRAGLIALAIAMIAAIAVAGRWRGPVFAFAAVALASLIGFFAVIATPGQQARVTEFGGGSGRSDIWTIGWRMVQAHPVHGIGVGQFPLSSVHYLLAPGAIQRSDYIISTPKVAHNIYLQILAETGVVGLIPFLVIIGFSLRCALRAARKFQQQGDMHMELMSRAVLVGLVAILVADFFASEQFSKQLWLLLGLGPALLAIAGRTEGEAADEAAALRSPLAPARLEPAAASP
jgi:exopolysaccharide production protein ExoQ